MLNVNILNKKRNELNSTERGNRNPMGAKKLNIYIPEEMFIKMKWSSVAMKSKFVEIKRGESYIQKKDRPAHSSMA